MIGMEESRRAGAGDAASEAIEQGRLHMFGIEARRDTDRQRDIERHIGRRLDFHFMAGEPISLELRAQIVFEILVHLAAPLRSTATNMVCQEPVQRRSATARCTSG